MKSPSEELVEIIAPKLVQCGLLLAGDADKYKAKLASGSMKSEDWLLAVEKASGMGET